MPSPSDFAAFILTHGRPDNVRTYDTLRKHGYTGPIYLIVDDQDGTRPHYEDTFENVIVFDQASAARITPLADNQTGQPSTVVFARNACFAIAQSLGLQAFIQLDDDYSSFTHRFTRDGTFREFPIRNLDAVFAALLRFHQATPFLTVAMAQGGDMFTGTKTLIRLRRKAMNSLVCSVDRPFTFLGRNNEDVNTYVALGATGSLFGTITMVNLHQARTQSQAGGMTDIYQQGTYLKSFYAVLHAPSCVRVQVLESAHSRIHHRVDWNAAVPKILSATHRRER